MIRGEDISREAFDAITKEFGLNAEYSYQDLADIANAFVQSGVLSPPCHVIKHDDGYVIDPGARTADSCVAWQDERLDAIEQRLDAEDQYRQEQGEK